MSVTISDTDGDQDLYERPRYSIGEVAEKSGLSRDTLRWYERIGLMNYVGRDAAGKRRFSDRDLNWLDLIGKLRCTGMSVADMLHYAELVRAGDATTPQRLEMFRKTRAEVLDRIEELQQTLTVLDRKITLYEARTAALQGIPSETTPAPEIRAGDPEPGLLAPTTR
ncbi:MerR family transcriptional regulator [Nocardia transvalensis]|uniref:MerR family transcriptional regulator n=1 Tax=Nocardia transvalensis TaxID=37333 RepID=UPI001895A7F2|nr:MerR family transcriptional regulator [Nocardia transvalensis]MBF6330434.1 MerR family transcriptional regulator [Nocardia transvalensis]